MQDRLRHLEWISSNNSSNLLSIFRNDGFLDSTRSCPYFGFRKVAQHGQRDIILPWQYSAKALVFYTTVKTFPLPPIQHTVLHSFQKEVYL